jgi:UDP-N-acetylmuramyl pentapeptide phosphotransferase/UDP-N-acetylglucosamine-1-phosphate transferase
MRIHGKLLFIGAVTASIFIAYKMFAHAMIAGIVCVLLAEISEFIRKRMEKKKRTCNECFHFMQSDLYTKPQYVGFCCHKQVKLDSYESCSGFQAKEM